MLSRINNRTLAQIAAYGAVGCITAVMFIRMKYQQKIREADFFRDAMKTLRTHAGAVSLLGEPIKELGFDLGNPQKNFFDEQEARFQVAVKGPNDRGTLLFWAERADKGWLLKKVELELKKHPDKRLSLLKGEENGS